MPFLSRYAARLRFIVRSRPSFRFSDGFRRCVVCACLRRLSLVDTWVFVRWKLIQVVEGGIGRISLVDTWVLVRWKRECVLDGGVNVYSTGE
ncbi:hypothetical protein [Bacteroides zoogleoformans]|uniref:hypothetical protein n=1 Tax=Bacteroides zoogleoformans TaxID=28119 RepID=UPI00101AE099|nr:hypothetical protein [Bacteroides zoogleoformans]